MGINILKEAVNGLEALEYIQTNKNEKINFVLLDLDIPPIMDGFLSCQRILNIFHDSLELEQTFSTRRV